LDRQARLVQPDLPALKGLPVRLAYKVRPVRKAQLVQLAHPERLALLVPPDLRD
jgi:hypothetical protein